MNKIRQVTVLIVRNTILPVSDPGKMSDSIPISEFLLKNIGGEMSQLGLGSYGKVMKGFWTSKNKLVAIKFVHKSDEPDDQGYNEDVKKEHLKEIENYRKLAHHDHKRIVKFYGTTRSKIGVHIVLEFVEGGSLHSIIEKCTQNQVRLDIEQKVRIALDIAEGMEYLHTVVKMVHRDLKPLNVLITRDWRAVLCDFGSARNVQHKTVQVGTALYFAPELSGLSGKNEVNFSCDVYSFGASLFSLFYERPPLDWPLKKFPKVRKNKRTMKKIVKLIKGCVKVKPDERIDMETAVEMLEDVMDDLKNEQLRLVQTELEETREKYKRCKQMCSEKDAAMSDLEVRLGRSEAFWDYLLKTASDFHWGLNRVHIDYHKRHEIYEQIVNAGCELDGKSLFILGRSYEFGLGMKRDKTKSHEYYKKAAEFYKSKNVNDLQPIDWATMGWMYMFGDGFKKDQSEGIRLLKRGVAEGNVIAMSYLGICYDEGYGVDVDYSESVKLYQKAADVGLPVAINNLADMYFHGEGVKEDEKKAFELYLKAAGRGSRGAIRNVGLRYKDGEGVKENLKEAKRWFKKAAALGDEEAKEELEQFD